MSGVGRPMDEAIIDLRASVQAGRGSMIEVSRAHRSRIKPPSLLIGAVTSDLLRLYHSQSVVLGTAIYRVREATVLGEGIVMTDGCFNVGHDLNLGRDYIAKNYAATDAWLPDAAVRRVHDPVVLLTGAGYLGYGHWLVDFLPKLHLLRLAGYRLNRLTFLMPSDTPDFARRWLAILGIEPHQCAVYDRTREVVLCRELIVPSTLRFGTRVSPLFAEACAALRDAAAPRRFRRFRRPARRRIFVARSVNAVTHNTRSLHQRVLFEDTARKRGFTIVSPERLGLREQVELFDAAGTICGEYGSGLHASMFSRPGTLVMAVRDDTADLGFLQSGIDQELDHHNGYVIGAASPDGDGRFSVDPADLDLAFDWIDWGGPGKATV